MAIDNRAVSVATTATRLDGDAEGRAASAVAVHNNGASTVYLGDSGVTTANGFPLAAGASVSFEMDDQGDTLYGIVASGTVEVRVLEVGV